MKKWKLHLTFEPEPNGPLVTTTLNLEKRMDNDTTVDQVVQSIIAQFLDCESSAPKLQSWELEEVAL